MVVAVTEVLSEQLEMALHGDTVECPPCVPFLCGRIGDRKLTSRVLKALSFDPKAEQGREFAHLKRIKKDDNGVFVLVCPVEDREAHEAEIQQLVSELKVEVLDETVDIPKFPPLTKQQFRHWNDNYWPMNFVAIKNWGVPEPLSDQDLRLVEAHMKLARQRAQEACKQCNAENAAVFVDPHTNEVVVVCGDETCTRQHPLKHCVIVAVDKVGEMNVEKKRQRDGGSAAGISETHDARERANTHEAQEGTESHDGLEKSTNTSKAKESAITHNNPSTTTHNNPSTTTHNNPSTTTHNNPSATTHNNPSTTTHNNPSATTHNEPHNAHHARTRATESPTHEPDQKRQRNNEERKTRLTNARSDPDSVRYLCTGLDVYVYQEPCLMCAMALVHSRVRRVFFEKPNHQQGGLQSTNRLHAEPQLNHRYRVFQVTR